MKKEIVSLLSRDNAVNIVNSVAHLISCLKSVPPLLQLSIVIVALAHLAKAIEPLLV